MQFAPNSKKYEMRLTYLSLKIEADKIEHRKVHPLIKRVH